MSVITAHFILYVRDQARSTAFYQAVLEQDPILNVPGMTEFSLPGGSILGLMPEQSIERLLGAVLPSPSSAAGAPRAEIYLVVEEAAPYARRALEAGARELSTLLWRDWGHRVAYCADPDGHVVAFAEVFPPPSH